jgi:hypothetical protein
MSRLLSWFIIPLLALIFLFDPSSAAAMNCSSIVATWNQDTTDASGNSTLSPMFSCQWVSASKDYNKDSPTIIKSSNLGRDLCECDGLAPAGQICACARTQDCSSIGGVCIKAGKVFADLLLADGLTRPEGYTINVPFRCPGDNNISCFVKANESASAITDPIITPETDGPTSGLTDSATPVADTAVVDPPQEIRPFSNCCSEIVPKTGNSYDYGAYGINHFVQIGINIYECILCIVAALMLLMFVIGSFYLLSSAGRAPLVAKGMAIIKAAIVGGIIVFASVLIVNFSVKALGGSFLDAANVKINPDVGPKSNPGAAKPTATGGLSSPISTTSSTPTSSSSGTSSSTSSISFENCSASRQDEISAAIKYLEGKNLGGIGELSGYVKSALNKFICESVNSTDGSLAKYKSSILSDGSVVCPSNAYIYPLFFTKRNVQQKASTLIHESVRYFDCSNNPPMTNCQEEQHAFSVQADYFESLGDLSEAKLKRCHWNDHGFYKDDDGVTICKPDPNPKC